MDAYNLISLHFLEEGFMFFGWPFEEQDERSKKSHASQRVSSEKTSALYLSWSVRKTKTIVGANAEVFCQLKHQKTCLLEDIFIKNHKSSIITFLFKEFEEHCSNKYFKRLHFRDYILFTSQKRAGNKSWSSLTLSRCFFPKQTLIKASALKNHKTFRKSRIIKCYKRNLEKQPKKETLRNLCSQYWYLKSNCRRGNSKCNK